MLWTPHRLVYYEKDGTQESGETDSQKKDEKEAKLLAKTNKVSEIQNALTMSGATSMAGLKHIPGLGKPPQTLDAKGMAEIITNDKVGIDQLHKVLEAIHKANEDKATAKTLSSTLLDPACPLPDTQKKALKKHLDETATATVIDFGTIKAWNESAKKWAAELPQHLASRAAWENLLKVPGAEAAAAEHFAFPLKAKEGGEVKLTLDQAKKFFEGLALSGKQRALDTLQKALKKAEFPAHALQAAEKKRTELLTLHGTILPDEMKDKLQNPEKTGEKLPVLVAEAERLLPYLQQTEDKLHTIQTSFNYRSVVDARTKEGKSSPKDMPLFAFRALGLEDRQKHFDTLESFVREGHSVLADKMKTKTAADMDTVQLESNTMSASAEQQEKAETTALESLRGNMVRATKYWEINKKIVHAEASSKKITDLVSRRRMLAGESAQTAANDTAKNPAHATNDTRAEVDTREDRKEANLNAKELSRQEIIADIIKDPKKLAELQGACGIVGTLQSADIERMVLLVSSAGEADRFRQVARSTPELRKLTEKTGAFTQRGMLPVRAA